MKKVFLLCMAVCLLLLGCEKAGVYNPGKKIKKIYQEINGVKTLMEEWTWDGNLLAQIQYYSLDEPAYVEHYIYEKNRLVKVKLDNGIYYTITCKNNKYDKIDCYSPLNILLLSQEFTYKNNKISTIVFTVKGDALTIIDDLFGNYVQKSEYGRGFMTHLLSPELIHEMNKLISKAKGEVPEISISATLKWNKNNLSELVLEINNSVIPVKSILTFGKYDNKENPLYHSFQSLIIDSKNNPLQITTKSDFLSTIEYPVYYEYKYDNQFPIQITTKDIGGSILVVYYEYQE
jgi:hypothetical protein